ncbi:MAG TPA: hypothetical protein VGD36_18030, partial [Xanthobacteraceae bacterium]
MQRVETADRPEIQAGARFQIADLDLEWLVRADLELLRRQVLDQRLLAQDERRRARRVVVLAVDDQLVEFARDLHVAVQAVVLAEDRAVEDRELALVRLLGHMVLQRAPQQQPALIGLGALVEHL